MDGSLMTTTKPFAPFVGLARWVAGLPPRNPPSRFKRWLHRLVTIAFLFALAWFFFLGPGVLLLPFSPPGFESLHDDTSTVYYEVDQDRARDVLLQAREAQNAILEFWGRPNEIESFQGTKIYLGETPESYFRLTGNHAGGSALFGNVIAINMVKIGEVLSLVDFLRHEMAHSYLRRRFGYFRKHLTVPMWFDEGSAVLVQGESPDMESLSERLSTRPRLVSVTSLRYNTDWENMVFMEGSRLARQQYGYVGVFVEYLEKRFGIEKIRNYLGALGWGKDPESVFLAVYGSRLAEVERGFLAEYQAETGITEEIELAALPLVPKVAIKWTLIFAVLALFILWSIRQMFRVVRFIVARS
jgi:hypothetical protein